jgi:hypothetical protein
LLDIAVQELSQVFVRSKLLDALEQTPVPIPFSTTRRPENKSLATALEK